MDSINEIVKKLKGKRLSEARINYKELDHEDLIALAKQEDQQAFEELLSQYSNLIKSQSRKFFLDNGTAGDDDLEQIASIGFWEAVKSYNPSLHKNGFGSYAKMIINRRFTDLLRKEDADVRKLNNLANSLEDTIENGDGDKSTVGDNVASKDLSPEEQFLGREGAKELMRFMRDKFSDKERDVVLRHIKGDKISQIAEETGMSYKSVENALMRIKNKLTDYLRSSYRESKKIRREDDIKFSDEEKKILESVITKVNAQAAMREAKIPNYDEYTSEQLEDELVDIDNQLEKISLNLDSISDDSGDITDELEELQSKLSLMRDFADEDLRKEIDSLNDDINKVKEEVSAKGNVSPDELAGWRMSDFV